MRKQLALTTITDFSWDWEGWGGVGELSGRWWGSVLRVGWSGGGAAKRCGQLLCCHSLVVVKTTDCVWSDCCVDVTLQVKNIIYHTVKDAIAVLDVDETVVTADQSRTQQWRRLGSMCVWSWWFMSFAKFIDVFTFHVAYTLFSSLISCCQLSSLFCISCVGFSQIFPSFLLSGRSFSVFFS